MSEPMFRYAGCGNPPAGDGAEAIASALVDLAWGVEPSSRLRQTRDQLVAQGWTVRSTGVVYDHDCGDEHDWRRLDYWTDNSRHWRGPTGVPRPDRLP